jgi:hypothetical protein
MNSFSFLSNRVRNISDRKLIGIAVAAAIASLASVQSGQAFFDRGQAHPFPPASILWYDVNDSISEGYTFVGGAAGIDQSTNEDCSMEAALAAVSRFRPGARLISDMIVAEPGGYQVTFEDDPSRSFSVNQADISKHNIKDGAKWAAIIETAALERFPALVRGGAAANRLRAREDEPLCALGLTVMTGHQADFVRVADAGPERLGEIMWQSICMNMPMTAASNAPGLLPHPLIVPNHTELQPLVARRNSSKSLGTQHEQEASGTACAWTDKRRHSGFRWWRYRNEYREVQSILQVSQQISPLSSLKARHPHSRRTNQS